MPVQRARFSPPAPRRPKRKSKTEIFHPTGGFHGGVSPSNLPPGFTPQAQNFESGPGYIVPRSGLSAFKTYTFGAPILGGSENFDHLGNGLAWASSTSTVALLTNAWSTLSVITTTELNGAKIDVTASADSRELFDGANIYDPTPDRYMTVFSNNSDWMGWFSVETSTTTWSTFTWCEDLAATKYARSLEAVNNRLCLFNSTDTLGVNFPTRLTWSARGLPRDFLLADGAGFEDLLEMRGEGQKAIRFRDFLILFTELEIWRAQPTLDDYAFRFTRIADDLGCPYPHTIVSTPLGVVFMGADKEVYATDGGIPVPLGSVGGRGPSRIQRAIDDCFFDFNGRRAWATYNQLARRYELNVPVIGNQFPTESFWYDIDEQTWFPQIYASHELAFGFNITTPDADLIWADLTEGWSSVASSWGDLTAGNPGRQNMNFSSTGSVFRQLSEQTSDDGTLIDARWKSHGLRQGDAMAKTALSEVWLDYESDSASSATVFVGSIRSGSDLGDGTATSLISTDIPTFIPTWAVDSTPAFEIRMDDGGRPRFSRFQVSLQDAGRF